MTLWIVLGVAIVTAAALWRAPWWLHAVFLVLVGGGTVTALVLAGGIERALPATALLAGAVGLLLPDALGAGRSARVAPRRKSAKGDGKTTDGTSDGGFEGVEVPGFDILEKVGSGGMASVYRARRRSDGTIVALKVPMEQYVADAKFIRRFHREAEVAQRLDHPNIVRTYEHGAFGVQHYMAMEFVDGRSLESFIEAGERDPEFVVDVMKRAAEALSAIHAAGIIHRDVKPANVMITKGGMQEGRPRVAENAVKLMDFGIAGGKVMTRLTMTGARVGTPVYMSPEQARGLKIDHRSDIYSLGLVLYEMLTGQTAFKGGYEAIVHQQIFQTPAPPRQLDVSIPKALDGLVMRMIAKDPDERPSLRDVIEVLNDEDAWDGEAAGADLPSRLVVAVSASQGPIRVLDGEGTLHASIGEVGPNAFPAAPLAIAVDEDGGFYAGVFEYRLGENEEQMLIYHLAEDGRELGRFGRYGMGDGELLYPAAIACAPGPDGDVYVLDGESSRILRFARDGTPRGGFGGRGKGQGTFDDPRMLVVGPDGKMYVLDHGNRQVQRFDSKGEYETRWAFRIGADQEGVRLLDGLTVAADGTLYVSDGTAGRVRSVTPTGRVGPSTKIDPIEDEPGDALLDLGVDHEGNLYAARRGGRIVRKYAPDGAMIARFDAYAPIAQMLVSVRTAPDDL